MMFGARLPRKALWPYLMANAKMWVTLPSSSRMSESGHNRLPSELEGMYQVLCEKFFALFADGWGGSKIAERISEKITG